MSLRARHYDGQCSATKPPHKEDQTDVLHCVSQLLTSCNSFFFLNFFLSRFYCLRVNGSSSCQPSANCCLVSRPTTTSHKTACCTGTCGLTLCSTCTRSWRTLFAEFDLCLTSSSFCRQWLRMQNHRKEWDRWLLMGLVGVTMALLAFFLRQVHTFYRA